MGEPVDTAELIRALELWGRDDLTDHADSDTTVRRHLCRDAAVSLTAAQQRISDLEAQCARVQRDADRYAWLRQFYNVPEESRSGMHNIRAVAGYDEVLAEAELDAAIDAAMAAKEAE